jgi:hypothetical protein
MDRKVKKTYIYSAYGNALSGVIERPFQHLIEVQAGISLPGTGGYGASSVEDFRFKHIVSFRKAYTQVSGSMDRQTETYTTLVSSTIEDLNILDVVTADRIVSRISSNHPLNDGEPNITPLGSAFEGLRIAGCPVDVHLDVELFTRLGTFEAFKAKFQSDSTFRELVRKRFLWGTLEQSAPDFLKECYSWCDGTEMPESKGIVACTLVKDIQTSCCEIQRYGHVIILPQFGRIFLGEFMLESRARHLTMLRVEMGSPVCGQLSAGEVRGNGTTYP